MIDGWLGFAELRVPVIAQVHGHCLAGGSELVACCDLAYVADDAKIGLPAVRFGVLDLQFHVWLMGARRAMEAVLTGDVMDGSQSLAAGYANRSYRHRDLGTRHPCRRTPGVHGDWSRGRVTNAFDLRDDAFGDGRARARSNEEKHG